MTQPHRGRPPHALDPDASHAARLGTEIRARRHAQGLTLKALAALIGFSSQHLSEVELAKTPVSGAFVAACDSGLEAHGSLLALLPAFVCERAMQRHERSAARPLSEGRETPDYAGTQALARALGVPLYAGSQHPSEADEDVDPLSRRSLLGAGVGAAFGFGTTTPAPASARGIDPELVSHWAKLLRVLYRHDAMFGPHEVLDTVRHEVGLIAQNRRVARAELRTELLRVESRWAEFASWLSNDTGDVPGRNSWADRATELAREIGYQDMVAWIFLWQSRWAVEERDGRRAIASAEAAGRTPGTSDKIRALCALKEAQGHALVNDTASCQRRLAVAHAALERVAAKTRRDDLGGHAVTPHYVLADEAHCWRPRKAIAMFEEALRLWPHDRPRGRGVQQARLALACAAADEPDRAAAEGVKALSIAQSTKSDVIVRQLTRLDQQLAGLNTPVVGDFRAAVAAM